MNIQTCAPEHEPPEDGVPLHQLHPPGRPLGQAGVNVFLGQTEEPDLRDEPGRAERRDDADDAQRQQEDRSEAEDDPVFRAQQNRVGKRIRKDLLFSLLVLDHVDAGFLPATRD